MIFKKARRSRKVAIAIFFVMVIMIMGFAFSNFSSAEETIDELLDVGFGGSFSSEKEYTNATGEKMDGKLTRRTSEENIKDGRVYLNSGKDGIDFNPRVSLGTDELDKPIIVEAKFKLEDEPGNYNTILSIGGNLYVRFTSPDTMEYGFDINHNGKWSSEKKSVPAPELDEDSTIAIAYEPEDSGAKMQVFMNGKALPAVSSTDGRPPLADTESMVGFGNEVHSAGQDRGFKGSISEAIVTQFEGSFNPSLLKTMKLSKANRSLLMYGLGDLSDTKYSVSEDEIAEGDIAVNGGETAGFGTMELSGDDSNITFKPTDALKDEDNYVGEILFNPSSLKPGNVLIDVAGAITVRGSSEDESMDVLINGQLKDTIDISDKLDKEVAHLSLTYQNINEDEVAVSLWGDGKQLGDTITLSSQPNTERNSVMFAGTDNGNIGDSFGGEVYGVSFASIEGEFSKDMFGLSGGPCTIPDDLEPGHQIKINSNECPAALAEKASQVRPKPKQVLWQQYEQTAFIHYGINTYYDVEWGGFDLDPDKFQPTDLDTDQWARSLKESGFKMAMLTVKHHDGFMLYPSRYTDFSVAGSSWKDGDGDVLREFVDSMHKYGLKIGVYLSPADHQAYSDDIYANGSSRSERKIPTLVDDDDRQDNSNFPTFTLAGTDYGEFFMNQLYEVLTEYGDIDEVWFDGAQGNIPGDAEEKYDWDSYYELINKLQPEAVIANTGNDVRWVGNESGFARDNEWSVLGASKTADGNQYSYPSSQSSDLGSRSAIADAAANGMDYLTWWPAEVDVSIREGWFYHDNQQPKSVDELRDIYYDSVARNSVLLLNIPPNKEGKFADEDVNRLKKWHQSIEQDFAINHAKDASVSDDNGADNTNPENVRDNDYDTSWQTASTEPSSIIFSFDEDVDVDRVVLQEDINEGQQVESFAIDVFNDDDEWEEVYSNGTIGYKRIATLSDEVTAKKFRVRILKSRGLVHLSEIGLYQTASESGAPIANVSDLKALVEQYEADGEFSEATDAAKVLKLHLTAVKRFEDTEQSKKVIKHLKSFKILLDNQRDEAFISDNAYNQLISGTDKLIAKWD